MDLNYAIISIYVLEVSKMILADDEGKLHWKYTCVHVYSHTYYTHIQHTDIYIYILEASKMILADDEGKLHLKYTRVHILYYVHTTHTHTHTIYIYIYISIIYHIYISYKIIYHRQMACQFPTLRVESEASFSSPAPSDIRSCTMPVKGIPATTREV